MRAHGNGSPVLARPSATSTTCTSVRSSRSSGAVSAINRPPAHSSCPIRCRSARGSPPMPTLPSMSRTVPQRPSPGSGSKTERRSAWPPTVTVRVTAASLTSTPRTVRPRAASSATSRPGPQPTSRTAPSQRSSTARSTASAPAHQRSTSSGSSQPSARRRNSGPRPVRRAAAYGSETAQAGWSEAARAGWSEAAPAGAATVTPIGRLIARPCSRPAARRRCRAGRGRPPRGRRRRCPRPAAGAGPAPRSPAASSRSRCTAPVTGVDIGTPRSSAGSGRARPSAQKPPSSAGPNQASQSAKSTVSRSGVTWGVSMPISRAGPEQWPKASARRASRPPAHWGTTSKPGGSQGPGRPSSTSTPPAGRGFGHRPQGVDQRGLGEGGGLLGGEGRGEPRLDPPGPRFLGDDEKCGHLCLSGVRCVRGSVMYGLPRPVTGGAGRRRVGRLARADGVPLRPPVPPQRHDCPQLSGDGGPRLSAAEPLEWLGWQCPGGAGSCAVGPRWPVVGWRWWASGRPWPGGCGGAIAGAGTATS